MTELSCDSNSIVQMSTLSCGIESHRYGLRKLMVLDSETP